MKLRKELWFGFTLMAIIVAAAMGMVLSVDTMTNGHYGLLMLSLVVVAIMLGFPTAFTLMGMGMLFAFFAYHSGGQTARGAMTQTLDLMVQRTFSVMSNDVLISIPLFVFMGYLVERANLIEKLFRSLHLALARVPGSLAVATLVTCAVFATATGIVGAVVTLMGLLALPQMLRGGYDVRVSAGAITAGGCLGILIPPSVLLIVYGATAGVSVVKLYAGAFFPGLMLAGLYIVYVILLAKIKPALMPPLTAEQRFVPLPPPLQQAGATGEGRALPWLLGALKGKRNQAVSTSFLLKQLFVTLLPLILFTVVSLWSYQTVTRVTAVEDFSELQQMGAGSATEAQDAGGLQAPPGDGGGLQEPPAAGGVQEPPAAGGLAEPPSAPAEAGSEPAAAAVAEPPGAVATPPAGATDGAAATTRPAPQGYWIGLAVGAVAMVAYYALLSFNRLEVFKMLLSSFFPLLVLITAVLGSIVFGLATPTEAAAVGALGGFLLAAAYRQLNLTVVKESVFLTAKTSAMVCWLFVGSAIFSAAFALLGGQELVENWVLGMNLSKTQFLVLSQVIIFVLGWPLEWTEIIVIFMPIFIPLLDNFGVDPLFFGLLVALNLQTAFLSPPVAMAAFYLKGVSPKHVTLNQIFAGMLPFMGIQVIAIILLYQFPGIGLWLPQVLYGQ
ncbi:TRAP transporter large permease subunit [Rivibacter subsaxonicus]|uniref:Tripartite ATP-independent transporter DctM subunit n=1 Tax=Rivibacter subsaxonicus TaxID=457575 RepID=A0A4Q7VZH6_9BURK|nr:TRAP transporter large permease subunit [Rivibacter subsaxonicus]RZU02103.1 tripartite ATP-independent transporter DctM subunit [Rivibacter subsaxonicus]